MNLDELVDRLARLPVQVYGYCLLAALIGPLTLRLLGLKLLAQLIRPAALAVLLGGIYAKQQASGGGSSALRG